MLTFHSDHPAPHQVSLVGHQDDCLLLAKAILGKVIENGLSLGQGGGIIHSHHHQEAGDRGVAPYQVLQLTFINQEKTDFAKSLN